MSEPLTACNIAQPDIMDSCYRVMFMDGVLASVDSNLPKGLNITDTDGGYTVSVSDTMSVDKPLHIVSVHSDKPVLMNNNITIEKCATISIIEHYYTVSDRICSIRSTTKVTADDSASLRLYKLQQHGHTSSHQLMTNVQLGKNAQFTSFQLSLGGDKSRDDIVVDMNGSGAQACLLGLYLPIKTQVMDHSVTVNHHVSHCQSEQAYQGVLNDQAKASFDTMVVVAKNATQSHAIQTNHNLLLSRQAEVKTNPQLEIYNDDVSCSHGATVGQLNDDQRFYLQSRGISAQDAEHLLVRAFYQEILERIELPIVRDYFNMSLIRKLSGVI